MKDLQRERDAPNNIIILKKVKNGLHLNRDGRGAAVQG
jgi:hypothetical protein